jgi:hypothetical protein
MSNIPDAEAIEYSTVHSPVSGLVTISLMLTKRFAFL